MEQLDELVWQDVCLVLTHPSRLRRPWLKPKAGNGFPKNLQARRENLRKARVSLEQQMERLTDAYLAKVLDLDEYKRRRQELEQRLQAIAGQVRYLEVDVQHHDELAAMVESIEVFCQRVAQGFSEATFEQKRQLIELLVDRVVVTGNEVEIRYVIPTSKSSEPIRFCHLRLDYFDSPMISDQGEHACWGSLLHRETAESVDHLMARLTPVLSRRAVFVGAGRPARYPATPWQTSRFEIRATGNLTVLESPMSIVPGLGLFPTTTIGRTILKQIGDILVERRLIVLGNQEVVPRQPMDLST